MTLEVSVTVKRGSKSHTYKLNPVGESKKGTFQTFSPAENNDLPSFSKLYVKVKQGKAKAK